MADQISVAEPVTGLETVEPVKTETSQSVQTPAEPQTVSTPKVEGGDNLNQTPQKPEAKYDGLFRSERKRMQRLEETNKQLVQKMDKLASLLENKNGSAKSELDHNLIWQKPDEYLTAREQKLRDEITALRNEFNQGKQSQVYEQQQKRGQDALEKLFPKKSADSKETLAERVQKDPERAERLKEFFDDPEISAIANINPDKAVALAIQEFGLPENKTDPTVLKKTAMGGVGSGNPNPGLKPNSEENLLNEKRKLDAELLKDPNLRFDVNFKKRKAEVLDQLTAILKEKRK